MTTRVTLLVSRFKEAESPLDLQRRFEALTGLRNTELVVYEKGGGVFGTPLPNVGREAHTVLHHIAEHYERLPDHLVSVSPAHVAFHKLQAFRAIAERCRDLASVDYYEAPGASFLSQRSFVLDGWHGSNATNAKEVAAQSFVPASPRPFGDWFERHVSRPPAIWCGYTAQFVASRAAIRRTSHDTWRRWRDLVAADGPNSEVAHSFERAWFSIFTVPEQAG
jgi:hypothetical protein